MFLARGGAPAGAEVAVVRTVPGAILVQVASVAEVSSFAFHEFLGVGKEGMGDR